MSNSHEHDQDDAHTGPIKTPSQALWTSIFSFVVPVFVIIALVFFVVSGIKPQPGAVDVEKATANRIARIGVVEVRDANRELKTGEEVYKAQCVSCHAAGAAGAPKFGDVTAWAARIKTSYDALLNSALKGKGAMGAQGGGDFEDAEIGRAVAFMANAAGAKFALPQRAAASAVVAATAPDAGAVAAAAQVTAAVAATTSAAAPVAKLAAGAGEALYKQACIACHAAGVAGAPKFADKAAWAPRIKTGIDALTASVVNGKGAMPARGAAAAASDAELRAAVEYLVAQAK